MASQYPLELVVKAVDKATAPLRALTVRVHRMLAPFNDAQKKIGKLGDQFAGLGKALNVGGIWKGLQGVGGAVKNVGSEIGSLATKFIGLSVGAAVAIGALVRGAEQVGSHWADASTRVGTTATFYASVELAAKKAGIENEAFQAGLTKLNKNLGEMKVGKGGGPLLEMLNKVSPAFAKQVKGAKNVEEAVGLLAGAFAKIEDPAKRAALETAAFGKGGTGFGVFLKEGPEGLKKMVAEFTRLNGNVDEFSKRADAMGDATDLTEQAFQGLKLAIAGGLFPALTKLADRVTEFLAKNRDGIAAWAEKAGAAIMKWVDEGGFEKLVTQIGDAIETVQRIVKELGPLWTSVGVGAVILAPLIGAVGSLGGALITLAANAIPLLITTFSALWPVLAPLAPFIIMAGALALAGKAIYDNWADIKALFSDLSGTIGRTLTGLGDFLSLDGGARRQGQREAAGMNAGFTQEYRDRQARLAEGATGAISPSSKTQAKVTVDFSNTPKGTRVSSDPTSSQPVALDVGYSLVGS